MKLSSNKPASRVRTCRPTRVLNTIVLCGLLVVSGCGKQKPTPAPQYRTDFTIKDLMDGIVDPTADALWDSTATITTQKGVISYTPKTDDDWTIEQHRAVVLMEATNLLQMPGRMVAHPGEKAKNPHIEESPEEIKRLIDADRATWIKHAHDLYDAVGTMKKAIDARDVQALTKAGEDVDVACEHCHQNYWYPHQYDNLPKGDGDPRVLTNPVPKPGKPDL